MRLPMLTLPSTGPWAARDEEPPDSILNPEEKRRFRPGVDPMKVDGKRVRFQEPEKDPECPDRICASDLRFAKVRHFTEVFCEELFWRYSAPFAAGATTSAQILEDQEQSSFFWYQNRQGGVEMVHEIRHPSSFRRHVAGQNLVTVKDRFGNAQTYVGWVEGAEYPRLQETFWNERTVAPPAGSANAPTEQQCKPRVCLVSLEDWANLVLQVEEEQRNAFRLDKLMDGMCELMDSAFLAYRTAYKHGEDERSEWIRHTTELIRLLGLYLSKLPDLAFSLAPAQVQNEFVGRRELLLVTRHNYEACVGPYEVVDEDGVAIELWPSDLKKALQVRLEAIRELAANPPDEDADEAREPDPDPEFWEWP